LVRCRPGWADAHTNRDAHRDTYGYTNRDAHRDTYGHADLASRSPNANGHADCDAFSHADCDTYALCFL